MKNYKDFTAVTLGASDIASLTVRCGANVFDLHFGGDGSYTAYFAPERCKIDAHFERVAHFEITHPEDPRDWNGNSPWLWIFDDTQRVFEYEDPKATEINIYRAGEMGCVIEFCQDHPNHKLNYADVSAKDFGNSNLPCAGDRQQSVCGYGFDIVDLYHDCHGISLDKVPEYTDTWTYTTEDGEVRYVVLFSDEETNEDLYL